MRFEQEEVHEHFHWGKREKGWGFGRVSMNMGCIAPITQRRASFITLMGRRVTGVLVGDGEIFTYFEKQGFSMAAANDA